MDDVELVLFESDEVSNLPTAETACTLKAIAEETGLSFTVHLPLDVQLGHPAEGERRRSVEKCLRVIERTSALSPFAYVIHFHESPCGKILSGDLEHWRAGLERSVGELLDKGVPGRLLCVETLDYSFELVEGIVFGNNLSICLDVGHVLLNTHPLQAYLDLYLSRCRVVHLHGVRNGKDHLDISMISREQLAVLFARLCTDSSERVVTLEVFNETDLLVSLGVAEGFVRCGA